MISIRNVRDEFNSHEVFEFYSDCMYMSNWKSFTQLAYKYIKRKDIYIYGYLIDQQIVGTIVVEIHSDRTAQIKGIAVNSKNRRHGIGKSLVDYVCHSLLITHLYAETDDDAVEFYRHCQFETENFIKEYESGECKRYKCILSIDKLINEERLCLKKT